MRIHLDLETRSALALKEVGLDRYSRNCDILMLAWAIDDGPVNVWQPIARELPSGLPLAMLDPDVQKVSWNVAFERTILRTCLSLNIPISQWLDPSTLARYASIGGSLAQASEFLGLGDEAKDKAGAKLIQLFCKPQKATKKRPAGWATAETHPEEWSQFVEYCRRDVIAERAVLHRLEGFFALPEKERRIWELDQKICETGLPVDMLYVENARRIVDAEQERLLAELRELTGCENPNSTAQLLAFLKTEGYGFSSLGSAKVKKALAA